VSVEAAGITWGDRRDLLRAALSAALDPPVDG
jgi:hypothetical protein